MTKKSKKNVQTKTKKLLEKTEAVEVKVTEVKEANDKNLKSVLTGLLLKINSKKLAKYLLIIAVISSFLYGVYKYRGVFIAATVNGTPISRLEVITELEKQGGKSVLDVVITKKLLDFEATEKKVTVTQKELDDKYTEISAQFEQGGQKLEDYLTSRSLSKQDFLKDQLRYEILINKLVSAKVKVSAEEVDNYIEQNAETYKDRDTAEVKKEVEQMIKQQKLQMETGAFLEELKKNAKIEYFNYQ